MHLSSSEGTSGEEEKKRVQVEAEDDHLARNDDVDHDGTFTNSDNLHPYHPKRWPAWMRHLCLLQLALNGSMLGFTGAVTIPAQPALSKAFDTSLRQASYVTSSHVLLLGLGPLLWTPLANRFGRRPCLVVGMLLSCVSSIGSAFAQGYVGLIVSRVFQGIGVSIGAALGGVIVVELFAPEHRAAKLNVWSVMVTAGPAVGALVGGFLVEALGWRWTFLLCAIINGAEAIGFLLAFPETQWVQDRPLGLRQRFGVCVGNRQVKLSWAAFLRPLLFLQNPAMVILMLVFGVSFGLISVGLSIVLPQVFIPVYNFKPSAVGLIFISYIIVALFGGQIGGRLSDVMMARYVDRMRRRGLQGRHEHRLWALLPGYGLAIAGLVTFGVTLQKVTHWAGPVIAFGVAQAGLQVVMNVVNTYCIDCYKANALDVTVYLNLLRQVFGFAASFWIPSLLHSCGYGLGVGILAIILFALYIASAIVIWKGDWMRERYPIRGLQAACV